jgi:hypothetical protein
MGRGSSLPSLLLILFLLPLAGFSQAPQNPVSAAPGAIKEPVAPSVAVASVDTALANRPKSRTDSVIVVKHSFEHREQIITGSVIMTCLMLMMVSMNNYNPR